jgi:hypothetical protein
MVLQAHEQVSGLLGLLNEVYGITNQVRGVLDYQSRRWIIWRGKGCTAFFKKLGRLHKIMVMQVSALVKAEGFSLSSLCVLQTEDAFVGFVVTAEKYLERPVLPDQGLSILRKYPETILEASILYLSSDVPMTE